MLNLTYIQKVNKVSKVTILYGTQTGNSERVASSIFETLQNNSINCKLSDLSDYDVNNFKEEELVIFVISTQGIGEFPFPICSFWEDLKAYGDNLSFKFAVIGLGDSMYVDFCKAAIELYKRLRKLGATVIFPLIKLDFNFEEDFNTVKVDFFKDVFNVDVEKSIVFSESNLFLSKVLNKEKLSHDKSNKEIYKVTLSIEGLNKKIESGDSIGIYPENPTFIVNNIIGNLKLNKFEKVLIQVEGNKKEVTVLEALKYYLEISVLSSVVFERYGIKIGKKLENGNLDLISLLTMYPVSITSQELVDTLLPLKPRYYSVASSLKESNNKIDIISSTLNYKEKGRQGIGVCTNYIAEKLRISNKVPIFVKQEPFFKLPPDLSPIIMIATGVGIAPFRAFVQEIRKADKVVLSWLFFGNQTEKYDFLFEKELEYYFENAYIDKLNTVFSRDSKKYVQDAIFENRESIEAWVKRGAFIYVCGNLNMGKDVNNTFNHILGEEKVKQLRKNKRYIESVY